MHLIMSWIFSKYEIFAEKIYINVRTLSKCMHNDKNYKQQQNQTESREDDQLTDASGHQSITVTVCFSSGLNVQLFWESVKMKRTQR